MRKKFVEFIRERHNREIKDKAIRNKEETIELRLKRMKTDAESRLVMIEDFKKTLDQMEWNEL
jgi:hypothetical protein